jgi:hypothetical protein
LDRRASPRRRLASLAPRPPAPVADRPIDAHPATPEARSV